MNLRRLVLAAAIFLGLSLGLSGGICAAQEITVAAAADLQFVMQDIGARFQSETGKSVKLDLRLFRQLCSAASEWRAVRHVLLGQPGLSEAT